jgi:hypothetical protein
MRFLLVLLLALAASASKGGTVRIGAIDWYTDYDQAMAVARKAGKPLWLHFGENPG